MLRRRRIRRTRGGALRIELPSEEREVLRRLLPQLRELLAGDSDDPRVRRLFPTAFPHDPEAEEEYQHYMREELVASRTAAIDAVEASLDSKELDEEAALAWMQSINSVRLVLGTMLDVSEDLDVSRVRDDDPDIQGYALYAYLSMLLDELLAATDR